jgi:aminotransferase
LIQDHFYVSLFAAIQRASITALRSSQECVRELVAVYEKRRDVFVGGLHKLGWDCPVPKGSFFTWVPVPNGMSSVEFSDHVLERAHVVMAPGIGFGKSGEGYVRVGLLAPEDRLREAVERLQAIKL